MLVAVLKGAYIPARSEGAFGSSSLHYLAISLQVIQGSKMRKILNKEPGDENNGKKGIADSIRRTLPSILRKRFS